MLLVVVVVAEVVGNQHHLGQPKRMREREKEKKNATEQNSISSKAHADMQVREEEVVDYLDASGRKELDSVLTGKD